MPKVVELLSDGRQFMQPTNLATNTRTVITGDEAQLKIRQGVELAYKVAKAAYGPKSGNVMIEAPYGDPIISHDGVFNLDHLHISDPGTDMAIRTLVQASRATNVHAGDGTTAAAVLAASLYFEASKLVIGGKETRMSVAKLLQSAAAQAYDIIDELKIPVTDELLTNVAIISASDEALGNLIADTIKEIGADGGVLVEDFAGSGVFNDIVDGFYFRRGFTNAALLTDPSNLESRYEKVLVLVCEKDLTSVGDIAPILEKCLVKNIHELVLIGTVQTEALAMAIKARLDGKITCSIVDSPDYGALKTLFMDDVALYCGATKLGAGANARDFDVSMLGEAKVVITEHSTTLINGDHTNEELAFRIAELKLQLKVATHPIEQEAIRTRLGRLSGKIAILRVGGNTDVERQEVKLRVEDAVAALQAAIKDGVVPGGGVTLARLSTKILNQYFANAFKQPFRALLENAGRNPDRGLWQILEAKDWQGFDLRTDSEKLIDLRKAGVVDPSLVIKEVVGNAASVAAELIKTTVLMPFDNRESKRG